MNYTLHSFSLLSGFCPIGFFRLKVFNEAINASIKGKDHKYLCTVLFFPFVRFFVPLGFSGLGFLMRQYYSMHIHEYNEYLRGSVMKYMNEYSLYSMYLLWHIRNLYICNLYTSMYIQCTYYGIFVTYTFVTYIH